ncbi:unnamed protein product [Dracunculus medinensis]|uniref:Uncharacterized protein n=1 Tax=Dracunculus medinensis TaxID=318479 RepID=A0A0N4UMQ5_DRAME|nr:unnamed protein product [Dracunculus medinensis]
MIEMIGAEGNLNDELIILGFIGRSDNSYGTTPMCSTPAWSRDLEATDSSLDRVVAESSVFYGQTSFIDGVLLKCADLKRENPIQFFF